MSRRARLGCMTLLLLLTLVSRPSPALAAPPDAPIAAADTLVPPSPAVRAWQTGCLRPDRLEHVGLAFTLGLGTGLLTRQPATAAATACGLGLAKEIRDRRHGGFDPLDLAADAAGAALAALATRALTR